MRRAITRAMGWKAGSLIPEDLENVSEEFKGEILLMNRKQVEEILERLALPKSGRTVNELKNRVLSYYHEKDKKAAAQVVEPDAEDMSNIESLDDVIKSNESGGRAGGKGADSAKFYHPVGTSSSRTATTAKISKRKKWRVTDPAEIPPNYYHSDLFRANFPLVNVVHVPAGEPFPVPDKFGGVALNDKDIFHARVEWIKRFFKVDGLYVAPENEQQAFPMHFSFMEGLQDFTRPSRAEVEKQNEFIGVKRKWCYDDITRYLKTRRGEEETRYLKTKANKELEEETRSLKTSKANEELAEETRYLKTRNANEELEEETRSIKSRKANQELEEETRYLKTKKAHEELEEENEGLLIRPCAEEVQPPLGAKRSDGDNADLRVRLEHVPELTNDLQECEDVATGFADGVVSVMDDRPRKRLKVEYNPEVELNPEVEFNPERVACVLERKFREDRFKWNARFQGGFYASKYCMQNIQRGHGAPVYVLVMTATSWNYGILVPQGYVQIRNGRVDPKCMPEFVRQQQLTGNTTMRFDKLEAKLAEGTEFYRKNYRDNPVANYADGPMLVGSYYLSSRWFSLPKAENGGDKAQGVRRFFDGLMRVVIGDSVLDMNEEDFVKRSTVRKQMEEERVASFFL